jgi:signal peptidase I
MEEPSSVAEPPPLPDASVPNVAAGRSRHWIGQLLWEVVCTFLPALFITLVINVFVAQAMVVDGPSMQPNLSYNERVIVEKITYRLERGPQRGDVITLDLPGEEEELIKRVVALAGETVEVRGGQVWINGELLVEPWPTQLGGPDYGPAVVPADHIFVLGDNRGNSRDSRYFGPISVKQVAARALLVYWPLDKIKKLW